MLAALRHRTNEWLIQRALTLMSPRRKRIEGMKGHEVFCPCCTGSFVAFLPFGVAGAGAPMPYAPSAVRWSGTG